MRCLTPAHLGTELEGLQRGGWFYPFWFVRVLNYYLWQAAAGLQKRLMINWPPQHGKSTMCSEFFPAWLLGLYPDKVVALVTYESDYSKQWGRRVRDILEDHGERLFGVTVDPRSNAADRWDLHKHRGGMRAVGIGGRLTGQKVDVLIVDDPVKNAQDAFSPTVRDRVWDWFRSTARTRLAPGGVIVVIQTRWHEDDLSGRIIRAMLENEKADRWKILRMPAIAESQETWEIPGLTFFRQIGEALCPERYPLEELEKTRIDLGDAYWFPALYQQRPSPSEGGVFQREWFCEYDMSPADLVRGSAAHPKVRWQKLLQTWDTATKKTILGSFAVGQAWGALPGADRFFLDQRRGQWEFPDLLHEIKGLSRDWPEIRRKLVEATAVGPAAIATLKRKIPGMIPVEVAGKGSKEDRARAEAPQVESRNVWVPKPEHAPWIRGALERICQFPLGPFKDEVDCMSLALADMAQAGNRREVLQGKRKRDFRRDLIPQ